GPIPTSSLRPGARHPRIGDPLTSGIGAELGAEGSRGIDCRCVSALHREQAPGPGHTLQLVLTAICKDKTGTDHEWRDSPRHENFTRLRSRRDASTDVDGDPGDVLTTTFDLTGVYARSDLEP